MNSMDFFWISIIYEPLKLTEIPLVSKKKVSELLHSMPKKNFHIAFQSLNMSISESKFKDVSK